MIGTSITDASLAKFAKIKSLKKLYLWQTKVTKSTIDAFKKSNPKIEVDMGWEGKELQSDTTKLKAKPKEEEA